jgi:hypothetical protein
MEKHPPPHDGKTKDHIHRTIIYLLLCRYLSRARSLLRSTMDGMPSHLCDKGEVNVIRMKVRDKLFVIAIDLTTQQLFGLFKRCPLGR